MRRRAGLGARDAAAARAPRARRVDHPTRSARALRDRERRPTCRQRSALGPRRAPLRGASAIRPPESAGVRPAPPLSSRARASASIVRRRMICRHGRALDARVIASSRRRRARARLSRRRRSMRPPVVGGPAVTHRARSAARAAARPPRPPPRAISPSTPPAAPGAGARAGDEAATRKRHEADARNYAASAGCRSRSARAARVRRARAAEGGGARRRRASRPPRAAAAARGVRRPQRAAGRVRARPTSSRREGREPRAPAGIAASEEARREASRSSSVVASTS